MAAGMTGLHGIVHGYGYDFARFDVLSADSAAMQSAAAGGVEEGVMKNRVRALIAGNRTGGEFVQRGLAQQFTK